MYCPVCSKEMTQEDFGGVKIDVCESGCKGLWFDHVELAKLDEKNEGVGQALQNALASERHRDSGRGRIKCPKCSTLMVAHFYKSNTLVTIDECYQCGGFYLDAGELEVIRDHFLSDTEREEYLSTLLGQKSAYAAGQKESTQKMAKVNPNTAKRMNAIERIVELLAYHYGK